MGGAVVLTAARTSSKVKGVICLNPLVFPTISFKDSLLKFYPLLSIPEADEKNFFKDLNSSKIETRLNITKNLLKKAEKGLQKIVDRAILHPSFFEQARKVNITDYAKYLRKPLLIIHGKWDEYIPVSHSEYLYLQAKKPKQFNVLNYGHNPILKEQDLIIKNIKDWLKNLI